MIQSKMFPSKFLKIFLDKVFNDCLACGDEAEGYRQLCTSCFANLEKYNCCFLCNENEICSCQVRSFIPFFYNNYIKDLILKFKYGQKFFLADFFADLVFDYTAIKEMCDEDTVFVSIPTTKRRLWSRTYNQSVLLTKSLAAKFGARCEHFVLEKDKFTSQSEKSSAERFINAQTIIPNKLETILGKKICIVDDVVASGNTILRCIELLRPFAEHLSIVAIAKT